MNNLESLWTYGTNILDSNKAIRMDYGIYRYFDRIIIYTSTGLHDISNQLPPPNLVALLEEWEKLTIWDLSLELQEKIQLLEETEQGKIFTKEQILPMLSPEILKTSFDTLLEGSNFTIEQKKLVNKAFILMKEAHKEQFRDEGLPYYIHPLKVAHDLLKKDASYEVIVSALLHDVLEDCQDIQEADLEKIFGVNILTTIRRLTKITHSGEKMDINDYLSKIAEDPSAIKVKAQDRINNIASTYFTDPDKKIKYINETENIYLPFFQQYVPESTDQLISILNFLKTKPLPNTTELEKIKQIHETYILSQKLKTS